jgi:hypothetical protein
MSMYRPGEGGYASTWLPVQGTVTVIFVSVFSSSSLPVYMYNLF